MRVQLSRVLILRELRRNDVALANEWITTDGPTRCDVIADDPTHWNMYYQASEAAASGLRRNEFDKIMGELQARKLDSPEANATLCRWQIDKGRIDDAKVTLGKLRRQSASP